VDAREQLRIANELFSSIGMQAFAERAQTELRATGEHGIKSRRELARAIPHSESEPALT
jgi:hypothetical protein